MPLRRRRVSHSVACPPRRRRRGDKFAVRLHVIEVGERVRLIRSSLAESTSNDVAEPVATFAKSTRNLGLWVGGYAAMQGRESTVLTQLSRHANGPAALLAPDGQPLPAS